MELICLIYYTRPSQQISLLAGAEFKFHNMGAGDLDTDILSPIRNILDYLFSEGMIVGKYRGKYCFKALGFHYRSDL